MPDRDAKRHLAHEVRASLNAIVGWAEVLRQNGSDQEMRERAAETILRHSRLAARRLDDLVADPGAPLAADPESTSGSAWPTAGRHALDGIHVVVVDDEGEAREATERVLRLHGALVATCGGAGDALALLRGEKVDVLLADIVMQGSDGLEFIRAVRNLEGPVGRTAAAAVTGLSTDADRERSLDAGFQKHLVKPVQPEYLVSTVRALAGRAHD